MRRRSFFKILGAAGLTSAAAGGGFVYGRQFEIEWWTLEEVSIPVNGLDPRLDGFRILLISDFHLYPHTRLEYLNEVVEACLKFPVDLAVYLGDFVQGTVDSIHDLAPLLARVNPRHGSFCVIGNHDIWKGRDVVTRALSREGLTVLVNKGLSLTHDGAPFFLAGVDDCWSGRPDLAAAMSDWSGERCALLLSHEPDPADLYSADSRITVQLSGHSHAGQVRIPGFGSPFLPPFGEKYDMGLYRVRDMWLYTNRGIGVTVPIRLNCRPEVTLVTLKG